MRTLEQDLEQKKAINFNIVCPICFAAMGKLDRLEEKIIFVCNNEGCPASFIHIYKEEK